MPHRYSPAEIATVYRVIHQNLPRFDVAVLIACGPSNGLHELQPLVLGLFITVPHARGGEAMWVGIWRGTRWLMRTASSANAANPFVHGGPPGQPRGDHGWCTFVRNHTKPIVAWDFLNGVTSTFKYLYVFVVIELGTRKLLHINVTDHPTVAWIRNR